MAPDVLTNTLIFPMYLTALRRPDVYLRLYRNAAAAVANVTPRIRAGSASVSTRARER